MIPPLAFLASPLGRYLAGAVAVLAVAGGLYWLGGRDARRDAERDAIKRNMETHERIRDAVSDPRTGDDVTRRLRELAK